MTHPTRGTPPSDAADAVTDDVARGGADRRTGAGTDATDPGGDDHALGDAALRARLSRVERKPPLYRAFRVSLYALYGLVATWLVLSITVAVWQSVFGEAGQALRARQRAPMAAQAQPAP